MFFIENYLQQKKTNTKINLIIISLLLSLYFIKCDLILRSPKDLQSQFKGKK